MPRYIGNLNAEEPYTIRNTGPIPKIEREEGLPPGGLDIAWVDESRKNDYHWSRGLCWHDRLHAHATLNSARRNAKCKRPYEPKDDLDFVLAASYCPTMGVFFEKTDPYLQCETAMGEDVNLKLKKQFEEKLRKWQSRSPSLSEPKYKEPLKPEVESKRLLRNRDVIYPDVPSSVISSETGSGIDSGIGSGISTGIGTGIGTGIIMSNGGCERRENIHNVKLGIGSYHSPQTNPGYSRTPSGAFYSV